MAAVCATSLAFFPTVQIRGEILRLGDVADLSALPPALAERAGRTALLRVDRRTLQTSVARSDLAAQAGARLPILAGCFNTADGDPVLIRRKTGDETPRVRIAAEARVSKGEPVAVQIASGPFTIERSGFAAGEAGPGERLFVRTANGQVIRTLVEGTAP